MDLTCLYITRNFIITYWKLDTNLNSYVNYYLHIDFTYRILFVCKIDLCTDLFVCNLELGWCKICM